MSVRDKFGPLNEDVHSVWDFGLTSPARIFAKCFTNQVSQRSVHSIDLRPTRSLFQAEGRGNQDHTAS